MAFGRQWPLCYTETRAGEIPMTFELYQQVALRRNLDDNGVKKGDVAVLVDFVPHPEGDEQGCVLEIHNALGESLCVVAVRESDIEPLNADEVLAVRQLAHVG